MNRVDFMLKPDGVSWESIRKCIFQAHKTNSDNGFYMHNSMMTSEELADYLREGYCFVAMQDGRVIGTNSLKIVRAKSWWAKGEVGYECLTAIVPEYRNSGAYFGLRKIRTEYAKKLGIKILQFDTHENNKSVQMIDQKFGFKYVRYCAFPMTDYYSVVMVKWLDGCPYSDRYINFRFKLSKFLTKLVFKPGRKFRFNIWKDSK